MEAEQKRLEEIMVALTLCFMGKDGFKMQEEVTKRVRELEEKKRKN